MSGMILPASKTAAAGTPFLTPRRRVAFQHQADTLLQLQLLDEARVFATEIRERYAGRRVATVATDRL